MRSHRSLPFAGKKIQACLHFYQHYPLKHDPHHVVGSGNQNPTWLDYTMTSSISRGSNSIFNYNVDGKRSDLFTYKKSNNQGQIQVSGKKKPY